MSSQSPSSRFVINIFSKKKSTITSQKIMSGGIDWYILFDIERHLAENYLSLSLYVASPKSLKTGWSNVGFYFVVLNQSNKELYRTPVMHAANNMFCTKTLSRLYLETLHLNKLQEEEFSENDKLIIKVYINVEEVEGEENVSEKKETKGIKGFQVLASQVDPVSKLFAEHPNIAKKIKPKNQVVKTEYMNVLLNLIETLENPIENLSETDLSNAKSDLCELTEQGFKLEWLRSKLEEGLKSKEAMWLQILEETSKHLELMDFGGLKSKLEEASMELKDLGSDFKSCDVIGFEISLPKSTFLSKEKSFEI